MWAITDHHDGIVDFRNVRDGRSYELFTHERTGVNFPNWFCLCQWEDDGSTSGKVFIPKTGWKQRWNTTKGNEITVTSQRNGESIVTGAFTYSSGNLCLSQYQPGKEIVLIDENLVDSMIDKMIACGLDFSGHHNVQQLVRQAVAVKPLNQTLLGPRQ